MTADRRDPQEDRPAAASTGATASRLFVAYALPDDGVARIRAWQEREVAPRQDLRVTHSLHLTLCFLGSMAVDQIPAVETALGAVDVRAVTVAAGQPLFLPERGRKRVLALPLVAAGGAPEGLERLGHVQAAVSAELSRRGLYTPEKRPWLPHVTVARFRRPGQPFSLQNVNLGELLLSRVVLYTSVLQRSGAIHTPLATFTTRQERSPSP